MDLTQSGLPSRFEFGDQIVVNLGVAGTFLGEVCGIIFEPGTIFYDIRVYPFADEELNKDQFVLLSRIRSYYVEKPFDRFKKSEYSNGYNGVSNVGLKLSEN